LSEQESALSEQPDGRDALIETLREQLEKAEHRADSEAQRCRDLTDRLVGAYADAAGAAERHRRETDALRAELEKARIDGAAAADRIRADFEAFRRSWWRRLRGR
jgi:hypothetical protein